MDFFLDNPAVVLVTQPEAPAVLPSSLFSTLKFAWSTSGGISDPVDQILRFGGEAMVKMKENTSNPKNGSIGEWQRQKRAVEWWRGRGLCVFTAQPFNLH